MFTPEAQTSHDQIAWSEHAWSGYRGYVGETSRSGLKFALWDLGTGAWRVVVFDARGDKVHQVDAFDLDEAVLVAEEEVLMATGVLPRRRRRRRS